MLPETEGVTDSVNEQLPSNPTEAAGTIPALKDKEVAPITGLAVKLQVLVLTDVEAIDKPVVNVMFNEAFVSELVELLRIETVKSKLLYPLPLVGLKLGVTVTLALATKAPKIKKQLQSVLTSSLINFAILKLLQPLPSRQNYYTSIISSTPLG